MGLDISFSPHKTLFLHHIAPFDKHFLGSFANFNYFLHQLSYLILLWRLSVFICPILPIHNCLLPILGAKS